MFKGEVLPTVLESITLIFQIENLDVVDVTHLLRHRSMSFSAHCTGDRDLRMDTALIKPSIRSNPNLCAKVQQHIRDAKDLYVEMVDSYGIAMVDARTLLPRCFENHYYLKVDLKSFIGYLHKRLDRQIQPESDNILAMKMLVEVAKIYPEIKHAIDLDKPDAFYCKTAPTNFASNLYRPEKRNDTFDWKAQWFVYPFERKEMPGGRTFTHLWNELRKELDAC